jgi:hypothetical protein
MNNILYNNLNNDSKKIIQNDQITIQLKEHQKTAINAMLEFEESGKVKFYKKAYIENFNIIDESMHNYRFAYNSFGKKKILKDMCFEIESNYGILADKIGSGKTFMTMGLITYRQIPIERERILCSSSYTCIKYKDLDVPIKTNLILVPHNLILQWKLVFEKCKLKTYVISKRVDIEFLIWDRLDFTNTSPDSDSVSSESNPELKFSELNCIEYYDVLIISSTMFDLFYENFTHTKWARIIIDEIVSIKLPPNLEFKCNFIWFLTATPSGIKYVKKNYIRFLVSSMSDNTTNNIIIKNNDDFVDESMNLPNINQIIIKCLTPKELKIIKDYVNSDIISMLNAGNIQDAIAKLNCNVETSDNILEVVTKKIKKELHNKKQELDYEQKRIPDDKKLHDERILKIVEKIKSLESQCAAIEERIQKMKEENCPICLCDIESPILIPCCNNIFCLGCITRCKTCPMCRSKIDLSTCIVINDTFKPLIKSEIKSDNVLCNKVDNLISILKTKPNGKFLVFSNYDRTFENINKKLTENNIKYSRLIGSNVVINNIIKRFESGEINIIMLNAINYGSGINLQMATDIIIYHELDLELETQVIGRAQRYGRTEPLNVYYLLNDNEKINCKNPTLNLDIFADDKTMLEQFIFGPDKKSEEIIDEEIVDGKIVDGEIVDGEIVDGKIVLTSIIEKKVIKKKVNKIKKSKPVEHTNLSSSDSNSDIILPTSSVKIIVKKTKKTNKPTGSIDV